ncbi:hypothetical protein [Flavobacterium succinicans]|uniref:hypothetical protein n=1 Tax=Flavobacterium succinicans TaxID=29536 RepID=UPI0012FCA424|nr:hypothetical protein [Flavobacterium succinicans]
MKHLLHITLFLILCQISNGQQLFLKINGSSETESKTIDSLHYNQVHTKSSSIEKEILLISKKLTQLGYLENSSTELIKKNDSTYMIEFHLKEQTKHTYLYIGKNSETKQFIERETKNDTLALKYTETSSFLEKTIDKLEQMGYPLAKVQLENIKRKKNKLIADLTIQLNTQRKINQIVLKFKEEEKKQKYFPSNYLTQINKKFNKKLFNQNTLKEIKTEFENYSFAKQTKQPELLFSKDSTVIYVYIEKRKSNSFDGYLGIGNNEEKKTTLNGYLDIQLNNMLNGGEDFYLYWKSDGNNQKTFRTGFTLNYLFKTPLGLTAQLNIFKQDSTFQNSKTILDLNYLLDHKTKLYIGIESTTSSDIQNSNSNFISDFKSQFLTIGLNHKKNNPNTPFFPEKTNIEFRFGIGKRATQNTTTNPSNQKQYFIHFNLSHNFIINTKNSFNIKSQNSYLKSNTYLANELFRFGGLYSTRGFAENSLQANYLSTIITEYRYLINPSLYLHSILDYAIYNDNSNSIIPKKINNITGIGFGIGIQTNNGILKFSITNGTNNYKDIKFFNSIVNICYNVKF